MTAPWTERIIHGERFVLVPMTWYARVNAMLEALEVANARPDDPRILQAKADDNRNHAAERFPDLKRVDHPAGFTRWYDDDGDEVVFTPHGYRKERDVQ